MGLAATVWWKTRGVGYGIPDTGCGVSRKCGVGEKCGVYSGKCGVYGGKCGVYGVKCWVDGGKCGVDGEKGGVDGGKCGFDGGKACPHTENRMLCDEEGECLVRNLLTHFEVCNLPWVLLVILEGEILHEKECMQMWMVVHGRFY